MNFIPHTVMVVTPGEVFSFYLGCLFGIVILAVITVHYVKKLWKKLCTKF